MKDERGKVNFQQPVKFQALPEKQLGRFPKNTAIIDITNVEVWKTENTAPFNVTFFKGGAVSQRIHILGDGKTTLVYNVAKIVTNTGANKLLKLNNVYSFTLVNEVWYEDVDENSGGGGGGVGPTGPAGPAGTSVPFIRDGKDGRDGFPIQGAKGNTGATGANGRDGNTIPSRDGRDGRDGFSIPGQQGIQGIQGISGKDGVSIPSRDGNNGRDGFPGVKGDKGNKGDPGSMLFVRDGNNGRDGFSIPGRDGTNGTNGTNGKDGNTIFARDGSNGRDGFPGNTGPIGLTGPPGQSIPGRDGVNGRDSFIPGPKGDTGAAGTGGSGSLTLTTVEVSIIAAPDARRSGRFQITGLAGLTVGKPVLIQQAVGPYTNKGTRADEAEMDQLLLSAVVTAVNAITVYWNSHYRVRGNFKFNYAVSA